MYVLSDELSIQPHDDRYHGLLGTDAAPMADVATFLGYPNLQAFNTVGQIAASTGSMAYQTVTVQPGDSITTYWNFLSNEFPNDPRYNDFAFFAVSRIEGTTRVPVHLARLANTFTPATPVVDDELYNLLYATFPNSTFTQTGYRVNKYRFSEAGDYVVGYGVYNAEDPMKPSALFLDEAPEPGTLLLAAGGLGIFAWRRRRRVAAQGSFSIDRLSSSKPD